MHQTGPLLTTLAREIHEGQPIQWVRSPYAGVRLAHARVDSSRSDRLAHSDDALSRAIAEQLLIEGIRLDQTCRLTEFNTLSYWLMHTLRPPQAVLTTGSVSRLDLARWMGVMNWPHNVESDHIELVHLLIRDRLAQWLGLGRAELKAYQDRYDCSVRPILIDCSSL